MSDKDLIEVPVHTIASVIRFINGARWQSQYDVSMGMAETYPTGRSGKLSDAEIEEMTGLTKPERVALKGQPMIKIKASALPAMARFFEGVPETVLFGASPHDYARACELKDLIPTGFATKMAAPAGEHQRRRAPLSSLQP